MLLNAEIMWACLHLRVECPLGGAALEEWLVGLQEGVLHHYQRNIRGYRRIHDPQNIGQVPLGVCDGQRTRKIFILHIDDYQRSFHRSCPLFAFVLLMDDVALHASPAHVRVYLSHP